MTLKPTGQLEQLSETLFQNLKRIESWECSSVSSSGFNPQYQGWGEEDSILCFAGFFLLYKQ